MEDFIKKILSFFKGLFNKSDDPNNDPVGPLINIVEPDVEIIDVRQSLKNNPRGVWWSQFNPDRALNNIKFITVHHTADNINDLQRINEIEINNTHAYKDGYPRIPYHFWRNESSAGGRIYWCNCLEWVTWHAKAANQSSIGIALVGNYEVQEPDAELLLDLELLLKKLLKDLGLPKEKVFGHGELTQFGNSTVCPGKNLIKYVKLFRKEGRIV